MLPLRACASVLTWLFFAALLLVCLTLALVLAPFTAWDPDRRMLHAVVAHLAAAWLWLHPLLAVRVVGRDRLPGGPAVFVANHQSMLDILLCLGLRWQFRFVSKASLFRVPLLGVLMRLLGYLSIERGQTGSARRLMDQARGVLARGSAVLFFPEGTYGPGGPLLPFRRGAFVLAIEAGVPVVPIVLRGTRETVPGDALLLRLPGRLRATILPPIPPGDLGTDARALAERVRALMTAELGQEGP
ncbi:MAG: lysophospholipid acyltransferase family protein [bacterium]